MHGSFGHMLLKSCETTALETNATFPCFKDRDTATASHPTAMTSSGNASEPSRPLTQQQHPSEAELEHELRRVLESLLSALEKQRAAAAKLSKVRLASYMLKFEDELATQVKAQATAVDKLNTLHMKWKSISDAHQPFEPEAEPTSAIAPLQLLEIIVMAMGSVQGGAALDEQVSTALCKDIRAYVDRQMKRTKRSLAKRASLSQSQALACRRPAKSQSSRCQRQSMRRQKHQTWRQQQQEVQKHSCETQQMHRDQELMQPAICSINHSSDAFRSSDVLQQLQDWKPRPQAVKAAPRSRGCTDHGHQYHRLKSQAAGAPTSL